MRKVLFLDDNAFRHFQMKSLLLHDEAYTANEAIHKLQNNQYDVVFLDHDLGEKEMVSSDEEETGITVAKWMAEHKPEIKLIVIHSLNYPGAQNMLSVLKDAGYNALYVSFLRLKDEVEQLLSDLS